LIEDTVEFFNNFFPESFPAEYQRDYRVLMRQLFSGIVPVEDLINLHNKLESNWSNNRI
jgi:hypothetical protein